MAESIEEARLLSARRSALRTANVATQNASVTSNKALDASMKRCTVYVKKLKTITQEQTEFFTTEVEQLKLDKYITEIVTSILENKFNKASDYLTAMEILSVLHQKYADFSSTLVGEIVKHFSSIKTESNQEKLTKLGRYRQLLRLLCDLLFYGMTSDVKSIYRLVMDILQSEKLSNNMFPLSPLVFLFLRNYSVPFTGSSSETIAEWLGNSGSTSLSSIYEPSDYVSLAVCYLDPICLLNTQQQNAFRTLFVDYVAAYTRHILSLIHTLSKIDEQQAFLTLTKGDVKNEEKERRDQHADAVAKGTRFVLLFHDILGLTLPTSWTKKEEKEREIEEKKVIQKQDTKAVILDGFEDDETRAFYRNLPDLRASLPGILFQDSKKESILAEESELPTQSTVNDTKASDSLSTSEDEDVANPHKIEEICEELSRCVNTSEIDELARHFCTINSARHRNKLMKAVLSIKRVELLRYAVRLIAVLAKAMPEMAPSFHALLSKNISLRREPRFLIFLAETTKFQISPYGEIFLMLNKWTEYLSSWIDSLNLLLEHCGRYLFLHSATSDRMKYLIDTLTKKTNLLDERRQIQLKTTLGTCLHIRQTSQKETSIIDQYALHLLSKLDSSSVRSIAQQLDKLDGVKIVSKPWKVPFDRIPLLADVVIKLQVKKRLQVLEKVLEYLRYSLEENDRRDLQKRRAMVKYLCSFFVNGGIHDQVIYSVIMLHVTYGYTLDQKNGEMEFGSIPSDPPSDMSRVYLLCDLIAPIKDRLLRKQRIRDRKDLRNQCIVVLHYVKLYIYRKQMACSHHRLPMDVEFTVTERFRLLKEKPYMNEKNVEQGKEKMGLQENRPKSFSEDSSQQSTVRQLVDKRENENDLDVEEGLEEDNDENVDIGLGKGVEFEENQSDEERTEDISEDDQSDDDEMENDLSENDADMLGALSGSDVEENRFDEWLFDQAYEKMLRSNNNRPSNKNAEAATRKKGYEPLSKSLPMFQGGTAAAVSSSKLPTGQMMLRVITRNIESAVSLPMDHKLAKEVLEKQREAQKEKEEMKRLVLNSVQDQLERDVVDTFQQKSKVLYAPVLSIQHLMQFNNEAEEQKDVRRK